MERVPTTAEGLKVLADELKQLKSIERPAIIKAIAAAREHGDLSENAEYTSAREKQGFIEGRIAEIEDIISRAEVIDFSKLSGKIVKFGATVQLADEDTDEKVKYQIVGPYEADLAKRRISVTSPIGRALIGKTVGDTVEVQTPRGAKSYEVAAARPRRMPIVRIVTYWIRNSTTLLAMPQIDMVADQDTGSSVSARAMLSAAEPNISPAQMKPKR
jgi:transcription elongation factor GreA